MNTCTIEVFGTQTIFPWICAYCDDLEMELVKAGSPATYPAHIGAQIIHGTLCDFIELVMCCVDEETAPPQVRPIGTSWTYYGGSAGCPMSSYYWGPNFNRLTLGACDSTCFCNYCTSNVWSENRPKIVCVPMPDDDDTWVCDLFFSYYPEMNGGRRCHCLLRISLPVTWLAAVMCMCDDSDDILRSTLLHKVSAQLFSELTLPSVLTDLQLACIKAMLPQVEQPTKQCGEWIYRYDLQALSDEIEERRLVENMPNTSIDKWSWPDADTNIPCEPISKVWKPHVRPIKRKKAEKRFNIRKAHHNRVLMQWQ